MLRFDEKMYLMILQTYHSEVPLSFCNVTNILESNLRRCFLIGIAFFVLSEFYIRSYFKYVGRYLRSFFHHQKDRKINKNNNSFQPGCYYCFLHFSISIMISILLIFCDYCCLKTENKVLF